MIIIRFVILVFLSFQLGWAQTYFKTQKYGVKEGLISENIYKTINLPSGELYLATQRGLLAFDGYRFIENPASKNNVLSLFYHQNQIYFCDEKGLSKTQSIFHQPQLIVANQHTDSDPNNDHFENIFVDSQNRIWSTDFEHIKYLDPKTNKIFSFKYKSQNKNLDLNIPILELENGQIWSANPEGLWIWDENSNQLKRHPNPSFNSIKFSTFTLTPNKTWLLATENGDLFELHPQTNAWKKILSSPDQQAFQGVIPQKNKVVLYTSKQVYIWKNGQLQVIFSVENNSIQHVNYDTTTQVYWVATQKGLYKLSPINAAINLIEIPNNSTQITGITYDKNNQIWLIDQHNTVWKIFSQKAEKIQDFRENLININVSQNEIFLTTNQRIYHWNGNSLEALNLPNLILDNPIKTILTSDSQLWIVSESIPIQRYEWPSLNKINFNFLNPTNFWSDNKYQDILIDTHQRIWLVGWMPKSFGINYYDPNQNKFIDVSDKSINPERGQFVGDYYTQLSQGNDQSILISAYGGWNRIDRNGKIIQKIDVLNYEFADTYLRGIAENKAGNVFIATSEGLHIYRKDLDQVVRLHQTDGLPSNNCTLAFQQINSNQIAIGFEGKLALIDLDKALATELKARLKLTEVKINGTARAIENNFIELNKDERNLILSFSDLSFLDEGKVHFKFKFSDEQKWQDLGVNPDIYLNHIEPGKYTLTIQALDNLGNLLDQELEIQILAHPPFTKSTLFYVLLALLFIAIVLLINRYLWLKQQEKQHYIRKIKGAEMQTLRSQMNPHFLFNTLNSINSYIIQNQSENASSYLTKFSKLMRSILENSKLETISLKNELKTLKLYIELESARLEHSFDYEIFVDPSLDTEFINIPPLVIQPFVENAIWHGLRNKENGFLGIYIEEISLNHIHIIVQDNGIGREASQKLKHKQTEHKSYGIDITIDRINMLDEENSVEIQDLYDNQNKPTGTKVILKLKI